MFYIFMCKQRTLMSIGFATLALVLFFVVLFYFTTLFSTPFTNTHLRHLLPLQTQLLIL